MSYKKLAAFGILLVLSLGVTTRPRSLTPQEEKAFYRKEQTKSWMDRARHLTPEGRELVDDMNREINNLRERVDAAKAAGNNDAEIRELKQQLKDAKKSRDTYFSTMKNAQDDCTKLKRDNKDLKARLQTKQQSLDDANRRSNQRPACGSCSNKDARLRTKQESLDAANEKVRRLEEAAQNHRCSSSGVPQEIFDRVTSNLRQARADIERLENDLKRAEGQSADLRAAISDSAPCQECANAEAKFRASECAREIDADNYRSALEATEVNYEAALRQVESNTTSDYNSVVDALHEERRAHATSMNEANRNAQSWRKQAQAAERATAIAVAEKKLAWGDKNSVFEDLKRRAQAAEERAQAAEAKERQAQEEAREANVRAGKAFKNGLTAGGLAGIVAGGVVVGAASKQK